MNRALFWVLIAGGITMALTSATIAARKWFTPVEGAAFDPYFDAADKRSDLPPGMTSRVAYQESRYNPQASNPSGAKGIMQIIPRWHPNVDVWDPIDSIFYGAGYLRENYNRFNDWAKALAAYNWGPGNVNKAIRNYGDNWLANAPAETRNYVRDVTADLGIA